jgi:hypothetical protein
MIVGDHQEGLVAVVVVDRFTDAPERLSQIGARVTFRLARPEHFTKRFTPMLPVRFNQ